MGEDESEYEKMDVESSQESNTVSVQSKINEGKEADGKIEVLKCLK